MKKQGKATVWGKRVGDKKWQKEMKSHHVLRANQKFECEITRLSVKP